MNAVEALPTLYPTQWPAVSLPATIIDSYDTLAEPGELQVIPITVHGEHAFGAEVRGVDWSRPVSANTVRELIAIQDKYAVIVFRATGLDNERHIAFSQQLGPQLEVNPFYAGKANDRVGVDELWDVSNIELDGSLVKPDSRRWHHSLGNALWHTDSSYHQQRSKYSLLLSHGTPKRGGFYTHFADTRRAYADLPVDLKDTLADMVVEHDLWHSRKLGSPSVYQLPSASERAKKPPAHHRLVQPTPSGKDTLYVAAHAKRILGLDSASEPTKKRDSGTDVHEAGEDIQRSQALIWNLINHCTQPQYVFSLEWLTGGDMIWWDNRQSMHRANPYTIDMTARDVRRSTVIDDGPLAWGVA